MKKTVIYLTDSHSVGFRRQIFSDWTEGSRIRTADGNPCTIIKVVDESPENLRVLNHMIATLNRYSRGVAITKGVQVGALKFRVEVGRKVWVNTDAKLDYVDQVISQLQ